MPCDTNIFSMMMELSKGLATPKLDYYDVVVIVGDASSGGLREDIQSWQEEIGNADLITKIQFAVNKSDEKLVTYDESQIKSEFGATVIHGYKEKLFFTSAKDGTKNITKLFTQHLDSIIRDRKIKTQLTMAEKAKSDIAEREKIKEEKEKVEKEKADREEAERERKRVYEITQSQINILVMGNKGMGKTSLIKSFLADQAPSIRNPMFTPDIISDDYKYRVQDFTFKVRIDEMRGNPRALVLKKQKV